MAIITLDGFDFIDDINGNAEAMIVKGDSLVDEINYLKSKNIKSIYLTYFKSKKIDNLEFLKELTFIEKVNFNDLDIGYTELYFLKNLKNITLSIKNKSQHLDFSRFPKLEILSIDWYNEFSDLSKNKNLKELSIWKFKPKTKSLAELSLPDGLEKLQISDSNILSLEGLKLNNLREFEVHYCNSLKTLNGIDKFSNKLNILILDHCRKLTSYEDLRFAGNLRKLILSDSGDIPNIHWLKDLKNIKHFSFWNTKLIDGDTSPCFGIDYITFKNQKHYNYKEEEFRIKKRPI
jgi:hypothetical protein